MGVNILEKVDIIIYWVDGNDINWRKEYIKYKNEQGSNLIMSSMSRFKDWNSLKYIFRMIDEHMNWVNKVYFVTCNQNPSFELNKENVCCINHDDFIDKKFLPTFNSSCIELNFNRIRGLSKNFIIWNDDFFLFNNISRHDLIIGNNIRDPQKFRLKPPSFLDKFRKTNISNLNMVRNSNSMALEHCTDFKFLFSKLSSIFFEPKIWHFPQVHDKSIWDALLSTYQKEHLKVCNSKFRIDGFNQYLFRNYYLYSGMTEPLENKIVKNCHSSFIETPKDIENLINRIDSETVFVNLSETENISEEDFDVCSSMWNSFLLNRYPKKSKFEV